LLIQGNSCQIGNDVGKYVKVKATSDSGNLIIGCALITMTGNSSNGKNPLEEGSKKECGIAKKELVVKPELFK